jgi:hypothetical protein
MDDEMYDDEDTDRLLPDAVEVIREFDRASASMLQRRLKVGYARAAAMIDQLEARGYIGAFDGSNARLVLRRDDLELPAPDPSLVAAVEAMAGARSVLGLATPNLIDLQNAAALDEFKYFECSSCGRLEPVDDASAALVAALASGLGEAWWAELRRLAGRGELRAAVLQKEHRLTFEQATTVLDGAATLGLVRRSGISWSLAEPRCSSCLGVLLSKQEERVEAPGERDPIPAQMRFRVLQRDGFRCAYCGLSARDGAVLHVDHVVPVAAGGETTEDNLITACSACNLGKGATAVV